MFLKTQEEQMKSWEEYFSEIFNKVDNSVGSKQETRNVVEEEENSEDENEVNLDPSTKIEIQLPM